LPQKPQNPENFRNIGQPKSEDIEHLKDSNQTLPNSVRSVNEHNPLPPPPSDYPWHEFKEYLIRENHSVSSIKDKVCYAKRFHHILESMDARDLSKLAHDVKAHDMKACAYLSKFLGRYMTLVRVCQSE
jgi:hypothetical protein